MATKILSTKAKSTDGRLLISVCHNRNQRHIVRCLVKYQVDMVNRCRLQGFESCKALHNTWLSWIEHGYREQDIVSARYHHGAKARLQFAQREYIRLRVTKGDKTATEWRNLVTCVLRMYQCYGPAKVEMENVFKTQAKSRITDKPSKSIALALWAGLSGINRVYSDDAEAERRIYSTAMDVRRYLNNVENNMSRAKAGICDSIRKAKIQVSEDDYSLLLKKGPHLYGDTTFTSIFGEALDIHALSNTPVEYDVVDADYDTSSIIPDADFAEQYSSLLDVVDALSKALLAAFMQLNSTPSHKIDLVYSAQSPVGTVPFAYKPLTGRILNLADKAGKTRVIAIVGYVTNNALKPIHDYVVRLNKSLGQDSTIQDIGIAKITKWTKDYRDAHICSADLSAATDKLPIDLQSYILYRVLKMSGYDNALEISRLWRLLLMCLVFKAPDGTFIRYGQGQPMGVYSSWPMLDLTNHILARSAIYCTRGKDKEQPGGIYRYTVCGDDIVLLGRNASERYMDMMESLGVKVNRQKSHICESSDPTKIAEFCKRLIVNGERISSESPKLAVHAQRDSAYLPGAIHLLQQVYGPLRRTKLTDLVGHRVSDHDAYTPYRYGGYGLTDHIPLHERLLDHNFIFLYIYKKMRGRISSLETKFSKDPDTIDQRLIDSLSAHKDYNPYRQTDKDWRLMGRKCYTPIVRAYDLLHRYESFITGQEPFSCEEICDIVRDTFKELNSCLQPIMVDSDKVKFSASQISIRNRRAFKRAYSNVKSGKCHTFAFGVQPINILIDADESELKQLVYDLDKLLVAQEQCS